MLVTWGHWEQRVHNSYFQGRVCVYIPWIANMVAVIGFEATTMGLEYAPTYHPPSVSPIVSNT